MLRIFLVPKRRALVGSEEAAKVVNRNLGDMAYEDEGHIVSKF